MIVRVAVFAVKPSRLDPGSIPTEMSCKPREAGSLVSLMQKIPTRQNGLACFRSISSRARFSEHCINGTDLLSTTGTNLRNFRKMPLRALYEHLRH